MGHLPSFLPFHIPHEDFFTDFKFTQLELLNQFYYNCNTCNVFSDEDKLKMKRAKSREYMARYRKRARQNPTKHAELQAKNREAVRKYRKKEKMRHQMREEQQESGNPLIFYQDDFYILDRCKDMN